MYVGILECKPLIQHNLNLHLLDSSFQVHIVSAFRVLIIILKLKLGFA